MTFCKLITSLKYFLKELLAKLRAGDIKSVDALHAFQYKALQVNPDLNCVVNVSEHHSFCICLHLL